MTLIEGGFGNRDVTKRRAQTRRARSRRTARAAAPLLIPLALALTLGVILAVSSGDPHRAREPAVHDKHRASLSNHRTFRRIQSLFTSERTVAPRPPPR